MSDFERRLAEPAGEAGGMARLEPASVRRRLGKLRATRRRRAAGGTLTALLVFTSLAWASGCTENPPPPAVSTSPSTAPTPAAGQSPAQAQAVGCHITVSPGQEGGGAGHSATVLLLRNNGTETCSVRGYPAVVALDSAGNVVAQAKQTPSGYMGGVTTGDLPTVTIAPGALASATFETLNANLDGTACKNYASLRVTVPGQQEAETITWGRGGCAEPQIHPVVPGETGRN